MKKINIFLASSIREFAWERMEIENFIRNVSDAFEDHYEIKLQPLLCENLDDAVSEVRKQEEYNQKIRGSELCYFLFFTKAGKYTKEEFDVALRQFRQTGKPKIYTYFKEVGEQELDESLTEFRTMLEQVIDHYYGTFSHIDTVKLRILLSLKLQEMDFLEIKADGGHCCVDGRPVLPLAQISEFANNQNLRRLQEELCQVEEEYQQCKPIYAKGDCDDAFRAHYSQVAAKRQNLMDEIEELQKLIFALSLRMSEDRLRGKVTQRQKEAYRLFELGDYDGCLAVLDEEEIDRELARNLDRIAAERKTVYETYVREYKTKIEVLATMTTDPGRFEKIEALYDKLMPIIFEQEIEWDTVLEYVLFLRDQQQDEKALEIASLRLKAHGCSDHISASCSNVIGGIYMARQDSENAYSHLMDALGCRISLYASDPKRYRYDLANSYDSMSAYYMMLDEQPDRAEAYLLENVRLIEELAAEDAEQYAVSLAIAYSRAGVFYRTQNRLQEADDYFKDSIKLLDKMSKADFQRSRRYAAHCYMGAASFYGQQGHRKAERHPGEKAKKCLKNADRHYQTAFTLFRSLAVENPMVDEPGLAMCCFSYAVDFHSTAHLREAYSIAQKYPNNPMCQRVLCKLEEIRRGIEE